MTSLHTGDPVATLEGATGVVWAHDRTDDHVLVEWADGTHSVEHEGDLLTEVGICWDGGNPHGPDGCGAPTWPGQDRCTVHGGHGESLA